MSRCPWRRMPWSDWIWKVGKMFFMLRKSGDFFGGTIFVELLKIVAQSSPKILRTSFSHNHHASLQDGRMFQKVSTNWRDSFFTYVKNREECTAPIIWANFPIIPKPDFFGEKIYSLRKNHHHFGWPRWFGRPYIFQTTRMPCLKRTAHPCNWCLENEMSFTFGAKGLFFRSLLLSSREGARGCQVLFIVFLLNQPKLDYHLSL